MTRIHGDPARFAEEAVHGFCDIHARLVRPVEGGVLRATATPAGKVALVVGGGSGHYPAFAGYVGPGFADAAVCGHVFTSPSTRYIYEIARLAERGGGVLLGFGNYAGDVLNFGFAAERLRAAGIDARVLAVSDDVASAAPAQAHLRRGIAGDLPVFKLAGAAAEAGLDLAEVERIARAANAHTRSFGVAFGGCTLPGASEPLFNVPVGRVALGLGIHGEAGIAEQALLPAAELAALLVEKLLAEAPPAGTAKVAAVLNGLGNTKYEELFVLWTRVAARLRRAGLELVAPEVGEFITSLDMAGCSLTLCWLDPEREALWLAPCDAPGFRRGHCPPAPLAPALDRSARVQTGWPAASSGSRESAQCIARALQDMAAAMHDAELELGRLDAYAGDGDHGRGMVRGADAAALAAGSAALAGAGAASTLAAAAHAWADQAGGTSGAIWGLLLLHWSGALSDEAAADANAHAHGARQALAGVTRIGGARIGDKTLVDALAPFAETLSAGIRAGQPLAAAWAVAAQAADDAAAGTRELLPKIGRARPLAERSKGHPDAGAVSLAQCARAVADLILTSEGSTP